MPNDHSLVLTPQLLDEILFAMEDQEHPRVLDLVTGKVVGFTEELEPRLLPLPEWTSLDGFQTMRAFTATLRHPELKAELTALLDAGVGVFKAFKTALKPFASLTRRWQAFKRQTMERRVESWAQDWQEVLVWSASFEEEAPLQEDFQIRPVTDLSSIVSLSEQAWAEVSLLWGPGRELAQLWQPREGDRVLAWAVEGPEGLAGFLCGNLWQLSRCEAFELSGWYVAPEYRGVGLGRALWRRMRQTVAEHSPDSVLIYRLPSTVTYLQAFFEREGGKNRGGGWEFWLA